MKNAPRLNLKLAVLLLGCLVYAAPLVFYAAAGANMRYSGDDYCYSANYTQHGFFGSQVYAYLKINWYNGNRFSLNLFSALTDLFGPYASSLWPALALLLWLAGLALLLRKAGRLAGLELPPPANLLAAEMLVFYTLSQTPDIDQSLYWRTGMLTYLAPILTGLLLAVVLAQAMRSERRLGWYCLASGLLALAAAGFSETAAVVLAAGLWLALLFLLAAWKLRASRMARSGFLAALGALAGTGAGMVLLALSPTILMMQPHLKTMPDLLEVVRLSLVFTRRFLSVLKSNPLPILSVGAAFLALALVTLTGRDWIRRLKWRQPLLAMLAVGLAACLLIFSSMLAYSYVQNAYPEPRAVIIPQFVFVCAAALGGWLAGLELLVLMKDSQLKHARGQASLFRLLAAAGGLVLVAGMLAPGWNARVWYAEQPRYQRWSAYWDRRDGQIRAYQEQGVLDVRVMEIDHIIPNVVELSGNSQWLYNRCAAGYYRVNTITADLPGWGK